MKKRIATAEEVKDYHTAFTAHSATKTINAIKQQYKHTQGFKNCTSKEFWEFSALVKQRIADMEALGFIDGRHPGGGHIYRIIKR